MSPERIAGRAYGTNADVWSLGLSLLTVITGAFPYEEHLVVGSGGGYWALWHAIEGSAAPTLPRDAGFSSDLCDFLDLVRRRSTRDEYECPVCGS